MALKGTLKDFGIAEILQLIGQQAKSGVLHLESRDEQIHIAMADGNVVRAESAGRKAREKLGARLVRAGLLQQPELDFALEMQKRTLRRLGDLLVEHEFVTQQALREMTALQTTETVFRLFHWKTGTYEFEAGDVEWDPETVTPLRAESVLMEGFRQVDEWPLVRKKITSTAMTFLRAKPMDGAREGGGGDDVEVVFEGHGEEGGERGGERTGRRDAAMGDSERRVYELAEPGRTVEVIVDRSRLGEFETCKALLNLLNQGYLTAVAPARAGAGTVGAYARDWQYRLRAGAMRLAATLAMAAALAGLAYWVDERGMGFGEQAGLRLRENAAQRFLSRYQMARLHGAIEVYRLEKGDWPERLADLIPAGLASPRDLRYPWAQEYHYRRRPEGRFVLLPPVE